MRVTEVRIKLVRTENDNKLRGYADVTFEGIFVVHGMKILQGKYGLFIAMPSKRTNGGEFKDIAHPITTELRSELEPAKHKMLDLIGDLYLTGYNPLNFKAQIIVKEAGHAVHVKVAKMLKDKIIKL